MANDRKALKLEIIGDADGAVKAGKQTEKAMAGVDDAVEKSSGKFAKLGDDIKIGLGLAGAAGGALLVKGFNDALDKEKGQSKLAIQLGLTPEQSKEAGKLAGDVYRQAFGDSLSDVNESVASVSKNIGGLNVFTEDQFKDITKGVLTLSDAFDQDLNKTTAAAGTILKTGLAPNAKAALDLLTKGLQGPANKADDLLDTFIEYSTQFRQLGLDGPRALGLLQQGLQGGARDADTVADALKEFAIRAQDGSTTTATAFQTIGLNATTMAQAIAGGGEPAAQALQMTFDGLNSIEDPALRAQTATGLFGTKAEDLQGALSALNVTTAVDQVGQVSGAMDTATAATATNQAKVEEWRRSVESNVTNFIADSVIPALDSMGAWWTENIGTWDDFHRGMEELGNGIRYIKDEGIDPVVGALQTLFGWLGDTIEKIENLKDKLSNSPLSGALKAFGGLGGSFFGGTFDAGGTIGGTRGAPVPILAHAGETVLPTHKMGLGAALKQALPGFDGGGVVSGMGHTLDGRATRHLDGRYQVQDWAGNWQYSDGSDSGNQKQANDNAALRFITAMAALKQQQAAAAAGPGAGGIGGLPTDGLTVIVQGNIYGEQQFVQTLRSGFIQAGRVGRGSLG